MLIYCSKTSVAEDNVLAKKIEECFMGEKKVDVGFGMWVIFNIAS